MSNTETDKKIARMISHPMMLRFKEHEPKVYKSLVKKIKAFCGDGEQS